MSLRTYLFALFAGLIALFSAVQLALLWLNEAQYQQQVADNARMLSQQVLNVAISNINSEQGVSVSRYEFSGAGGEAVTVNLTRSSAGEEPMKVHRLVEKLQQNVDQQLDNHFIEADDSFSWFSTDQNAQRAQLLSRVIWTIGLSALVALGIAFWSAHRFHRPFKDLSQGFAQLGDGNLGVQVTPSGVAEMRELMHRFNHTTERLTQLTKETQSLQAQAHLAEVGEISRGMAHALRSPLHVIGLSIERLASGECDIAQQEALKATVLSRIQAIDQQIAALLSINPGHSDRHEQVALKSLTDDLALELLAYPKKVSLAVHGIEGVVMQGDAAELRTVLHTLVVNAWEVSADGGQILIQAQQRDAQVSIMVIDHGGGVKPDIQAKLFEPHVSSKPEGAGMGLYIAKRIVSLFYQGELTLHNTDDGCCATLVLPLARPL